MIYKQIAVDPWQKFAEPITVVQYEGGSRTIKIQLNSGGLPIDLTAASVVFYAVKPDNTILYNACTITDAAKGLIEYTLTTQMCTASGELKCWIEVVLTTAVLRTQEFAITVQTASDSTGAIESISEFTALEAALATVGEYDSRITTVETGLSALDGLLDLVVPVGIILPWSLSTAPNSRWVFLGGQLLNRDDYPDLWALAQNEAVDESVWSAGRQGAFSSGDGSTTFRAPNFGGMVPVGYADGDTDFGILGKTLGAKTHSNTLSSAGYAQIAIQNVSSDNILVSRISVPSYTTTHKLTGTSPGSSSSAAATFAATLGGSTDAASNIQPAVVVRYVMRAK